LPDFGKILNRRKQFMDGALRHAHQPGRVYNVLTASQYRIHAETEFEQRRDTAIDCYCSLRRPNRPPHHLQNRAFPRPVWTDDSTPLATTNPKADMPNGPLLRNWRYGDSEPSCEALQLAAIFYICLSHILHNEHSGNHNTSTISEDARR